MPGIDSLADSKLPGMALMSGDCHAALAVLRTVIAGNSALLLAGVNLRSLNSGDCHAALAVLRTVNVREFCTPIGWRESPELKLRGLSCCLGSLADSKRPGTTGEYSPGTF